MEEGLGVKHEQLWSEAVEKDMLSANVTEEMALNRAERTKRILVADPKYLI